MDHETRRGKEIRLFGIKGAVTEQYKPWAIFYFSFLLFPGLTSFSCYAYVLEVSMIVEVLMFFIDLIPD